MMDKSIFATPETPADTILSQFLKSLSQKSVENKKSSEIDLNETSESGGGSDEFEFDEDKFREFLDTKRKEFDTSKESERLKEEIERIREEVESKLSKVERKFKVRECFIYNLV